ncbi:MAG: tyrosine-protein phosphatase [Rhodocyclaceae bacterium]|nr:tyrosine-protein phosphatase [Rhodocyclaceae bacterium]
MTKVTDPTSPATPSSRSVGLQGAPNCRDLGGYPAADGRRVKWRHLYRSDSFADLTDADLPVVQSLGLRTLVDLRHASERERKPNRELPGMPPKVHTFPFLPYGHVDIFKRVSEGRMTLVQLEQDVWEAYRRFLPEPVFPKMIDLLLTPGVFPMLIHCTSGKDRTGYTTAVVLLALGVPRDVIIEDFLVTNRHRRDIGYLVGDKADPAVVEVLSGVHASYLEASFTAMEQQWGSTDAYLRDALGLSDRRRQQLQDLLLERVAEK